MTEKDDKETVFSGVQWHRGQEVRPRKQAEHKSVCVSGCAGRREEAPGVLEQQPGSSAPRPTGTLALGLLATALLRGPCWQVLAQGGVGGQAVLSGTAPAAPPTGSPRAPRTAQDQACGVRALALLSQRAVVLPLLLSPSRSPRLSTSTQKWLQQPLAQGSALHL